MIDRIELPSFFRLVRHERIASTNEEAKILAGEGAAEGALVWALEQSAGRGRRGRTWVSARGNLFASLLLRPAVPVAEAAQLGFAAALAVGEACQRLAPTPLDLAYKWPNDVLLEGRKLAGILLESAADAAGRLEFLVVGIGINLASHPDAMEYPATSLQGCGLPVPPPGTMLGVLAECFLAWYERWRRDGFAPLRDAWLAGAQSPGTALRVRLPREELTGSFAGIDTAGALLLDGEGGRRRIAAGEVFPIGLS